MNNINLKNKVAVVTGGAQGFGIAIAKRFLVSGAQVVIWDIDEKILLSVEEKNITKIIVDVTNFQKIEEATKETLSLLGRIDILVNNAGINIPEHFMKVQKRNMEAIVKLNTIATFHIAQLCSLKMMETKNRKKIGGSIINMSSQMGHVGGPMRSVYNMTKFGLEGLTKGMAIDLAKNNIRVNTVCPTFIVTPMTKKFLKNKKFKNNMLKNIPLGRFADVSDVATAVTFLASNASSMITGTSILIDGGWTAQ